MSSYQPNIPTGTVDLDQDYLNIQHNFQQLDTSFGINHIPFSVDTLDSPAGYHTEINFVPFSTTTTNPPNNNPPVVPAATAGFGQIYSAEVNDGYNTDTNLFYKTGANRNYQLTTNFTPAKGSSSANAGYTFLPGGIVMQWGVVNGSTTFTDGQTGTVLFVTNNINFATKLVMVQATLEYNGSAPSGRATVALDQASFSTTGFDWQVLTGGSGSYTRFNWLAIGF